MLGIYFSGTGNSKFAAECFCKNYDKDSKALSIEDQDAISEIKRSGLLVFSYPVQYSTVPKILRDFITNNSELWMNKKVFIIATMGLFSGDGSGILGRLLHGFGAEVIGGLHLKMPDSIGDEKALKRPLEKNKELVKAAESKIKESVRLLKEGKPTREGLGPLYQMAGLFGQRLYFGHKTKEYSSKLKINADKCVGCGLCVKLCPMNNITVASGKAVSSNQCTMCYRCINKCPKQAITLLGKKIVEQSVIEKYV
ncbi:MAG: 4Fe-4S dicluster domain-containing protein [Saccharofermentans sp.]|nr:4Fe-4S dicluster domain-containing protein [Saccharofermentans sp.]